MKKGGAMKCPNCKKEMTCRQGEHLYKESGLDNIYLDGIEICECSCNEKVVSIPAITDLHNKIAFILIKKKSLLNSKEMRFLRKDMGLKAKELAEIMGVDNATISRWENDAQTSSETRDRLLRLIYSNIKDFPTDEVKHLIKKDFLEIMPEQQETSPYMIPRNEWSKSEICFTK